MMISRYIDNKLTDLENANRNPIYGYQELPLLSLEDALAKITQIIPSLNTYIPLAKRNCKKGSTLINDEESAAIYLYSMPTTLFEELNSTLRSRNRINLKPWFPYLKLLLSAIEKLPSQQKLLWRAINDDGGAKFCENEFHTWWGINSCSISLEVIEIYLGNKGTLFAISAINAKDISEFSAFPEEKEFILLPGLQLRVKTTRLNFRNTLYIADLEECDEHNVHGKGQ